MNMLPKVLNIKYLLYKNVTVYKLATFRIYYV